MALGAALFRAGRTITSPPDGSGFRDATPGGWRLLSGHEHAQIITQGRGGPSVKAAYTCVKNTAYRHRDCASNSTQPRNSSGRCDNGTVFPSSAASTPSAPRGYATGTGLLAAAASFAAAITCA